MGKLTQKQEEYLKKHAASDFHLDANDRTIIKDNFFMSLKKQYESKGYLSPKQIACIDQAIDEDARDAETFAFWQQKHSYQER